MNLKLVRMAGLVVALSLLSACSMFTPSEPDRLMFGLTPTNELGYEVDTSGIITITNRNMLLSTKAGMPMTSVTGTAWTTTTPPTCSSARAPWTSRRLT